MIAFSATDTNVFYDPSSNEGICDSLSDEATEDTLSEERSDENTPGFPIAKCKPGTMAIAQQQQRAWEDRFQAKQIGPFRYYAVFDGHAGAKHMNPNHVADYLVKNLHKRLAFKLSNVNIKSESEVINILIKTFTDFDTELYNNNMNYGATCTMVLIHDEEDRIYQVNLGDSRSIIFNDTNIISVTVDHDPSCEKDRIKEAGGYVSHGRLCGAIAVSRAFGDFEHKTNSSNFYDSINGKMCAIPDVTITPIQRPITNPLYILLTSDAPFEYDYYTNTTLVEAIQKKIRAGETPDDIVTTMVKSIAKLSTDDTTLMLVTV